MGYQLPTQKRLNPRTARPANAPGQPYLVLLRAHYISGFGLCQPGAVVTLGEGTNPGRFLLALTEEQATACASDPVAATRLANEAGAKLKAELDEERKTRPSLGVLPAIAEEPQDKPVAKDKGK